MPPKFRNGLYIVTYKTGAIRYCKESGIFIFYLCCNISLSSICKVFTENGPFRKWTNIIAVWVCKWFSAHWLKKARWSSKLLTYGAQKGSLGLIIWGWKVFIGVKTAQTGSLGLKRAKNSRGSYSSLKILLCENELLKIVCGLIRARWGSRDSLKKSLMKSSELKELKRDIIRPGSLMRIKWTHPR